MRAYSLLRVLLCFLSDIVLFISIINNSNSNSNVTTTTTSSTTTNNSNNSLAFRWNKAAAPPPASTTSRLAPAESQLPRADHLVGLCLGFRVLAIFRCFSFLSLSNYFILSFYAYPVLVFHLIFTSSGGPLPWRQLSVSFSCYPFSLTRFGATGY